MAFLNNMLKYHEQKKISARNWGENAFFSGLKQNLGNPSDEILEDINANLSIRGILDILPQPQEKRFCSPNLCPKNAILAKIGEILGHKIVKNDFFSKSHHKKLDIHVISHFSPYLDY